MCARVSERVGGRVLGGEKAQKARPLRRERERERERRETYPLSHRVAQPNPNQATRGRDSSATSSPRAYLSWSCPPSVLRSRIPQQQAVSPGRGLVLGLGLGLSFLLLVFLRLLPVAHDLCDTPRHSFLDFILDFSFRSYPPSTMLIRQKKRSLVVYIRKYEEQNSVASGGGRNLKPRETHRKKAKNDEDVKISCMHRIVLL